MSQGRDEQPSKELISIETDDPDYWYNRLKEARKERIRSKTHKFRIFKGFLIEDVR